MPNPCRYRRTHVIAPILILMGAFQTGRSGEPTVLLGHTDAVYDVVFSPDGKLLASGSYDNSVKLWRVTDGTMVATLEGHHDQVPEN